MRKEKMDEATTHNELRRKKLFMRSNHRRKMRVELLCHSIECPHISHLLD
jgi:hypothetical protein